MKNFYAILAALAIAGCSSYSEIAKWESDVTVNDGEKPLATFITQNMHYELLGFIPLCTGLPWTSGEGPIVDEFNVRPFAAEATVENNLKSLNHALDLVGSHRIAQLQTTVNDSSDWSLFIVNRHEVRTRCIILPEKAEDCPPAAPSPTPNS